jgi:hypothetical protein
LHQSAASFTALVGTCDTCLASACRRIVTAAVTALWRRRALEVQAAVTQEWLTWAVTRRARRALVERSRARSSARVLAAAFEAWQVFVARAARRRVLLARGIMRTSTLKQAAAFKAWKVGVHGCVQGTAGNLNTNLRQRCSSLLRTHCSAVIDLLSSTRAPPLPVCCTMTD